MQVSCLAYPMLTAPRPLSPGEVVVYQMALDLPPQRMEELMLLLDDGERERAERFKFEELQRRFSAAHGQVREVLSALLPGTTPAGLRFATNPYGKPFLVEGGLCFNLSHSQDQALLAVTLDQPVGVDIEAVLPEIDIAAIAERFFAPSEARAIAALPEGERLAAFYTCWTRKEAYIKARGLGLGIPLDAFAVSVVPGGSPALVTPEKDHAGQYQFFSLDPGPRFMGALCVNSG